MLCCAVGDGKAPIATIEEEDDDVPGEQDTGYQLSIAVLLKVWDTARVKRETVFFPPSGRGKVGERFEKHWSTAVAAKCIQYTLSF